MAKMLSTDDFKKRISNNIILLEEYNGSNNRIKVKCSICGHEWNPYACCLSQGTNCPNCEKLKRTKSHEQFANELSEIHPNIILLERYKNAYTKILCECCIDGHRWKVAPTTLLRGSGCPACGNRTRKIKLKKSHEDFLKEFNILNLNITLLGKYIDCNTKIMCRCNICDHEWETLPNNLLNGHSCPKCAKVSPITHNEFLERIKFMDDVEDYEVLSEYKNCTTKIKFLHKKCKSVFEMTPVNFQAGQRCPICRESKGEKRISKFCECNNIHFVRQKTFVDLVGVNNGLLSYDFYLPQYNLLIEYQGEFHDGNLRIGFNTPQKLKSQQEHDKRKREYAKLHNIDLLEIWYWDYENIEQIIRDEVLNK